MAFDIDRYTATSKEVSWADLDFDEFKTKPLPEHTLRSLKYMCDVEYHTVCYLRDMLVTPSHKDADVTAFMTMWNREEFWHGEAPATVLTAHGWDVDFDELKAVRLKVGWKDRLDPIKQSLLSNAVGSDFIAVLAGPGGAPPRGRRRRGPPGGRGGPPAPPPQPPPPPPAGRPSLHPPARGPGGANGGGPPPARVVGHGDE